MTGFRLKAHSVPASNSFLLHLCSISVCCISTSVSQNPHNTTSMGSKPALDNLQPSDLKTIINAVVVKLPEFYPSDLALVSPGGGTIWYSLQNAGWDQIFLISSFISFTYMYLSFQYSLTLAIFNILSIMSIVYTVNWWGYDRDMLPQVLLWTLIISTWVLTQL